LLYTLYVAINEPKVLKHVNEMFFLNLHVFYELTIVLVMQLINKLQSIIGKMPQFFYLGKL
jgi:hypothetical protein